MQTPDRTFADDLLTLHDAQELAAARDRTRSTYVDRADGIVFDRHTQMLWLQIGSVRVAYTYTNGMLERIGSRFHIADRRLIDVPDAERAALLNERMGMLGDTPLRLLFDGNVVTGIVSANYEPETELSLLTAASVGFAQRPVICRAHLESTGAVYQLFPRDGGSPGVESKHTGGIQIDTIYGLGGGAIVEHIDLRRRCENATTFRNTRMRACGRRGKRPATVMPVVAEMAAQVIRETPERSAQMRIACARRIRHTDPVVQDAAVLCGMADDRADARRTLKRWRVRDLVHGLNEHNDMLKEGIDTRLTRERTAGDIVTQYAT